MARWKVVRLDYLFSVIIPCLIAIYVNGGSLHSHLETIFGWAFLGVAGNVINDIIDDDRDLGWRSKELAAVAMGSILLSVLCFVDLVVSNPLNLLWILLSVTFVLLYCLLFKKYPIVSTIGQVIPEILFPYFTIHIPNSSIEWLWILSLLFFGFLSQFVHETIDEEAISTFSPRITRVIVYLFSSITLVLGAFLFVFTFDYNILPFAFVPAATMYIFRNQKRAPAKNIKDIGLILGNFFMAYFILLVL
ncbi:MAG: hypothetical protein ACTSUE_04620 [Promethearchaeota archaeon]